MCREACKGPGAEAASHQGGEHLEAALVDPSTLASAYRAIINGIPRVVGGRVTLPTDYRPARAGGAEPHGYADGRARWPQSTS